MARRDGAPRRITTYVDDGSTVVVRGAAGIGKTTAVRRALRGRRTAFGQALSLLSDLPYHPLAHAVGQDLEGSPADVAADVAGALGDRPLVIEDAHWADDATLDVLDLLAGRVPLIVTSRHRLRLENAPGVVTVDVPPLSTAQADSLARRLHPTLQVESRSRLVELAGGNPLLLTQLAAGDVVSPTLVEAVRGRLARLSAAILEQLAALALHGRPVPADQLAAAGAAAVLDAGALVMTSDAGVTLAHHLLADAVIDLLDDETRRRVYLRLAALGDDADAARHLLAAGDVDGAATAAERAAQSAPPASRAQLLSLAVDARGRSAPAALRLDAATALLAVHRPGLALAVLADVETEDQVVLAEVGWRRAQSAWLNGDEAAAESQCEQALALVDASGAPVEVRLRVERVAQRVRTRVGDPCVIEEAEGAWAAAAAAGVDRARARSLVGLALAHNGRPGWEEHYRAAAELARADGDLEQELSALYWLVSGYGFYGPMSEAIALAAESAERCEQLGLRRLHHHFFGAYAVDRLGTGTAPDELLDQVRHLVREDPLFRNRAQLDLALAVGLVDRGDFDAAVGVLAAGGRFARNDEDRSLLCVGLAELAWARGDRDGLASALTELATCSRGFFGMNSFAESAAIHLLLFDDPSSTPIPRFPVTLMPVVDVVTTERAAFEAWRRGETSAAIDGLAAAAEEWCRRGFVRFAARAHVAVARAAAGSGRVERGARHLGAARGLAERWRLVPIRAEVEAAETELSRARHRTVVSPRELTVLELVAVGATTSAIADRLAISENTVVTHINSARTKLGAATRVQAASMVARQ